MENRVNTALEIGQRCRRMRQAQGISQQELAEKLNTTPQNISKYETQGISNIEIIQKASEALGHDLLQDEMDNEGTVGEIGIEILQLILKEHLESDRIIHGELLYGLAPDRVIHELFKLEKIGLCVREQYTNFDGKPEDRLFITAKGVIALKHSQLISKAPSVDRKKCGTYENLCKEYSSIQEFIDNNPVIGTACKLIPQNGFRINLIHYLQSALCQEYLMDRYAPKNSYFPGKSGYYDILFSMTMNITRDDADQYIINNLPGEEVRIEPSRYIDPIEYKFISDFCKEVQVSEYKMRAGFSKTSGETEDKLLNNESEKTVFDLWWDTKKSIERIFEEERDHHESECPIDWFSTEDIRQYIEKNILPPENKYEEKLHQDIIDILTVYPQTRDYFVFPRSWEDNGLADLVREKYGLPNWND